jgi:hypothetical protein
VVSLPPALALMVGEAKNKRQVSIEIRATLAPARAGTRLTNKVQKEATQKILPLETIQSEGFTTLNLGFSRLIQIHEIYEVKG